MAGERRRTRYSFGILFVLLATVLLIGVLFVMNMGVVHNKIDHGNLKVYSLYCTFENLTFHVENVVSNATGERLTLINITLLNMSNLYTRDLTQEEFVNVGMLHHDRGDMLAFCSEKLENTEYVVDRGTIIYLNVHGSDNLVPIVEIDEIHEVSAFELLLIQNSKLVSWILSFFMVLTYCLFCLPFIEYYTNRRIEKMDAETKEKP